MIMPCMNSMSFPEMGGSFALVFDGSVAVGWPGAPGWTTTWERAGRAQSNVNTPAKTHLNCSGFIKRLTKSHYHNFDRQMQGAVNFGCSLEYGCWGRQAASSL